ncbi:hypothetical protein BXU06_09445 [Aquaspirillum sp. LM1]|nr:hypothetical protein BXU06_09445 [Aquaspirillum sp. LM1]
MKRGSQAPRFFLSFFYLSLFLFGFFIPFACGWALADSAMHPHGQALAWVADAWNGPWGKPR